MKIKFLTAAIILGFLTAVVASGQVPGGSPAREIPTEVQKTDGRVDQVIEQANDHFRKGKLNLEDNNQAQARIEFDKAVDEILLSGLDVRFSSRLSAAYYELVEKIYREEIPLISKQGPQIQFETRIKNPLRFEQVAPEPTKPKLCTNELFEKASIRGLRLRMTSAQIRSLIPALPIKQPNMVGQSEVILHAPFRSLTLKDLLTLDLKFLDGKLYEIDVTYQNGEAWETADQFIAKISESFGLPSGFWEKLSEPNMPSTDAQVMLCNDSDIAAGIYRYEGRKFPVVILTDRSADKDVNKRIESKQKQLVDSFEKLKDENRRAFKP